MRMILEEILSLKRELEPLGTKLMQNDMSALTQLKQLSMRIASAYESLMADIPELQTMGVELPADVLLAQLRNYIDACEYKDMMMLSDSINYEVLDTLALHIEILEQLA